MKYVKFALIAGLPLLTLHTSRAEENYFQKKLKGFAQKDAQTPAPDPILARVGDETITRSDVLRHFNVLPPDQRSVEKLEDRKRVVQSLADEMKLVELAREARIEKDPEFQKAVKPYRDLYLRAIYVERLRGQITVSEAEIQDYYKEHASRYADGPIRASHILTKSQEDIQRAERMLQSGKSFADVARKLSIDRASAERGGRMGALHTGKVDPGFEAAFRALKKGEISRIVWTRGGFEIIRKDEEIQGPAKPLAAVKPQIEIALKEEKLQGRLNELKSKISVSMDEDQINALDIQSHNAAPLKGRLPPR